VRISEVKPFTFCLYIWFLFFSIHIAFPQYFICFHKSISQCHIFAHNTLFSYQLMDAHILALLAMIQREFIYGSLSFMRYGKLSVTSFTLIHLILLFWPNLFFVLCLMLTYC